MKRNYLLIMTFLMSIFGFCVSKAQYPDYQTMLTDFLNMNPIYEQLYEMKDASLVKDCMKLQLTGGALYLCDPLDKKNKSFVYVGKGDFTFIPNRQSEANELVRYFGSLTLEKKIKGCFVFAGDDLVDVLKKEGSVKTGAANKRASELFNKAKKYLTSQRKDRVWAQIANNLLDGVDDETLLAYIVFEDDTEVMYKYCPNDYEEVTLYKCEWVFGVDYISKSVCQFKSSLYNPETEGPAFNNEINIINHKIKCEIASDLDMNVIDSVTAIAAKDNPGWINAELFYRFKIKRIYFPNGDTTLFRTFKEMGDLWIKLNPGIKKGDTIKFSLVYEGKAFYKIEGKSEMISQTGWYLQSGFGTYTNFDVNFIYFQKLKLTASGKMLNRKESGKFIIENWVLNNSNYFSFNAGDFLYKENSDKELIPFEFYYYSVTGREVTHNRMENSFKFFNKIYGGLPFKKINIAESGYSGRCGYDNFLQFPSNNFNGMGDPVRSINLTPKAIASLWWGADCQSLDYRDYWLEDALNTYSCLLYYQYVENSSPKVSFFLQDAQKKLKAIRSSFAGKGIDPGSLSIGTRNVEIDNDTYDYDNIRNYKGPWVIHMIRRLLTNLNDMNDSLFFDILKDFHKKYSGKHYTYVDFKNHLNEKLGASTDWFFEQWVENYKIPKYTFAYKIEPQANGKYKIRFRIAQENVPPTFRASIPIRIVYDEKRYSLHRITMVGEKAEFDMDINDKADKVIFNELQAVLCEVVEADY